MRIYRRRHTPTRIWIFLRVKCIYRWASCAAVCSLQSITFCHNLDVGASGSDSSKSMCDTMLYMVEYSRHSNWDSTANNLHLSVWFPLSIFSVCTEHKLLRFCGIVLAFVQQFRQFSMVRICRYARKMYIWSCIADKANIKRIRLLYRLAKAFKQQSITWIQV